MKLLRNHQLLVQRQQREQNPNVEAESFPVYW